MEWILSRSLTSTWVDVALALTGRVLDQFTFGRPTQLDGLSKAVRTRGGLENASQAVLNEWRHAQQPAARVPRDLLTVPELLRLALAGHESAATDPDAAAGVDADPDAPWSVETLLDGEEPIAAWSVAQRTAFLRRLADESLLNQVGTRTPWLRIQHSARRPRLADDGGERRPARADFVGADRRSPPNWSAGWTASATCNGTSGATRWPRPGVRAHRSMSVGPACHPSGFPGTPPARTDRSPAAPVRCDAVHRVQADRALERIERDRTRIHRMGASQRYAAKIQYGSSRDATADPEALAERAAAYDAEVWVARWPAWAPAPPAVVGGRRSADLIHRVMRTP